MKQEKNNIQKLIQKTNDSVQNLEPENQAYFDDLIVYMASSSLFHDEGAIREQLYQMVLDFSDAEKDGITAQEFFGENPQEMADELVKDSPRISKRQVFEISLMVGAILVFFRLLSSFASKSYLQIAPLVYLSDTVLGLVVVNVIFYLVAKTIYEDWKKWQLWLASSLTIILAVLLRYGAETSLVGVGGFVISWPWDVILLGSLVSFISIFLSKKEALFRMMLIPIVALFLVGLLKRWSDRMQITDPLWTVALPIGLICLSLLIFYFYSWKQGWK